MQTDVAYLRTWVLELVQNTGQLQATCVLENSFLDVTNRLIVTPLKCYFLLLTDIKTLKGPGREAVCSLFQNLCFSRTFSIKMASGPSEPGGRGYFPEFGRNDNPTSTRGALAHHVITFPSLSNFQTFLRPCVTCQVTNNFKKRLPLRGA